MVQIKIGSNRFNMQEFAGAMGDFGTLFPLAIGYIYVNGLNPAGFLTMMGIANIATGVIYGLPMPIQPMKILAAVGIAEHWTPSMIFASAFGMGLVWIIVTITGAMRLLRRVTPMSVVHGIQIALGLILAIQAWPMLKTWWLMAVISIVIVFTLKTNRYAPAAIVLMVLGLAIVAVKGQFHQIAPPSFTPPTITTFSLKEVWQSLVGAGFMQIPLTIGNAVIATAALIRGYWPERTDVDEHKLSLNQGVMNLVAPFFGGMPMCHGAGGLAGQYFFGARTGGTNVIEGTLEVILGLFFAASTAGLFAVFPQSIMGAMLLLVGVEMTKFAKNVKLDRELVPMGLTVVLALYFNMAVGFFAGLVFWHLMNSGLNKFRPEIQPR